MNRRKLFVGLLLSSIVPLPLKPASAQEAVSKNENGEPRHNISSYRYQRWQDHFKSIRNGAILSDTAARCLHYWNQEKNIHKI